MNSQVIIALSASCFFFFLVSFQFIWFGWLEYESWLFEGGRKGDRLGGRGKRGEQVGAWKEEIRREQGSSHAYSSAAQ